MSDTEQPTQLPDEAQLKSVPFGPFKRFAQMVTDIYQQRALGAAEELKGRFQTMADEFGLKIEDVIGTAKKTKRRKKKPAQPVEPNGRHDTEGDETNA
jgi:hypothetical protein